MLTEVQKAPKELTELIPGERSHRQNLMLSCKGVSHRSKVSIRIMIR